MMPKRLFPWILLLIALGFLAVVLFSPRSPMNKKADVLPYPTVQTSPTGLVLPLVPLEGMWYSQNDGTRFAAEVTGDKRIKIAIVGQDGESLSYWDGSFDTSAMPDQKITSTKNKEAFCLSVDDTKDFQVKDDKLSFEFKMDSIGLTKRVVMARA